MSTEPQLFRVYPETKSSRKVAEVEFAHLGLHEQSDIQEWVAANPGILGDDLLIVAKEFNNFDRTNERLDLLAVDADGKLVIIELKRDYSGINAHWQAIKYASYLRHATHKDVVSMLRNHESISESNAEERLIEHTSSGTLEDLNSDQRIILASHRFAREVTSAVLWLNEKALVENLITCIQLIPHQDGDSLYVQTNTIIPVLGTEPYTIQVGRNENDATVSGIRAPRISHNRTDEITKFVLDVEARATARLPDALKTDSNHGWARGGQYQRWFSMWYEGRYPWAPTQFSYIIHVNRRSDGRFSVVNNFEIRKRYLRDALKYTSNEISDLKHLLGNSIKCEIQDDKIFLRPRCRVVEGATDLDDALVERTAQSLVMMIEAITDSVNEFVKSHEGRSNQ